MRRLLLLLAVATPASADDKATAETLFLRAKQLEKDGDLASACPLYEASYRADPGLGALLNTANCHEAIGKTGSAWAEFREAAELAKRRNDTRAAFAQRRAAALEPRLVRLRVEAPAGVTVHRNGVDMTSVVDEPLVLDPGAYTLAAEAPGHRAWSSTVDVSREGETVTVRVPALERVAEEATPRASAAAPRAPSSSSRRTWAFVVGGAGIAVAATGLAFGGYAYSEWRASRAADSCDGNNVCSDAGRTHIASARSAATKSTLLVAGGGALVATAVVLWWTAPRTERAVVAPLVDGTTAGVAISGGF